MNRIAGIAGWTVLLAACCLAAWRIVGLMQAERYARSDPETALAWHANDPAAMLALSEARLETGRIDAAEAIARRLLAREPLQGEAYRVLAAAADARGDRPRAFKLYEIAERRALRDLQTRAWLTQRMLEQGRYAEALVRIDRILRMSPQRATGIVPVLVKMAQDPEFAQALAACLKANPPWRSAMLAGLRDGTSGDPVAEGRVLQALQAQGGLSEEESAQWLDSLIAQGRWGEAQARWLGNIPLPAGTLPWVFNGDFSQSPTGRGFDWRTPQTPGVLVTFEPAAGAQGMAAHLDFMDRQVANAGIRHALALPPGAYAMRIRMRAMGLRSAIGLQWRVSCAGPGGTLVSGNPVDGNFDWRTDAMDFDVPEKGCPGQWLELVNPVLSGAARRVAGDLWVDQVQVDSRK